MDVAAGTPLPELAVDVDPDRMKVYAGVLRDPSPIHWDRAEVAKRGLGERLINQGPLNMGYVLNLLLAWTGPRSLRSIDARFTSNVFDGDRVVASGVVTAIREENGERLADCDVWLERPDGTRAVTGRATVALPA